MRKKSVGALVALLLLLLALPAIAEELKVAHSGNIVGFTENTILLTAPRDGIVTLRVTYGEEVYRTLRELPVTAGENSITWDGLAVFGERLVDGDYTLEAEFADMDGTITTTSAKVKAARCKQAMLLALPSSDTLYLDDEEAWFIELQLVRAGSYTMEICAADAPDTPLLTRKKNASGADVFKYKWDGTLSGKKAEPGVYLLRFYATENPAYAFEVPLTIAEGTTPVLPLTVTGAVMPTPGMTDEELWALMQQPSAVTIQGQTAHQNVYAKPDKKSDVLGTLHGQSQGVEVMEIRSDGWVRIGAWNHETGIYIEGYVPADCLTIVSPNPHYGLLIDKQTQTMTLFHEGERVASAPISTGLVTATRMIRETAAGSFLTVDRIAAFSDSGYKYDYCIRYDGGNLLHQLGYKVVSSHRDFSLQMAQLGTKASHGCVRLPKFTEEDGLNAYLLYTTLPYHTRIILLDDPEQRAQNAADVGVTVEDVIAPRPPEESIGSEEKLVLSPAPELGEGETAYVITLGGDAVLGTREAWMKREDAFPAYLAEYGMAYPFSGLMELFGADDMTFINLECVLKETRAGEDTDKLYRFRGLPEYTGILLESSVEQVNIANNHHIDYGKSGRTETRAALEAAGIPYSGYTYTWIWEIDGHKIGFAGCRETIYRQKKTIIAEETAALREAGCEVVIYTFHWGTEYDPHHNDLQLEMARAAAEAGVDIVVGGHPHVVQGFDRIGGTAIIWSLGNLMFGGTIEMTTFDATLVQAELRFGPEGYEGVSITYVPILTSSATADGINDYHPVIATGEDRARILALIQDDSGIQITESMFLPANPR